jgi:hypothetical protein
MLGVRAGGLGAQQLDALAGEEGVSLGVVEHAGLLLS